MDVPTEVIEGCQQGRPEAFEELIRLSQREVYSLALRLTGNPDDAAEVAHGIGGNLDEVIAYRQQIGTQIDELRVQDKDFSTIGQERHFGSGEEAKLAHDPIAAGVFSFAAGAFANAVSFDP